MTEIQRYLAEEVAEDLADGIITRREALRRLGLLGLSARGGVGAARAFTAAAAAAKRRANAARRVAGAAAAPRPRGRPSPRESITFAGPAGTLMAAWAPEARAAACS